MKLPRIFAAIWARDEVRVGSELLVSIKPAPEALEMNGHEPGCGRGIANAQSQTDTSVPR